MSNTTSDAMPDLDDLPESLTECHNLIRDLRVTIRELQDQLEKKKPMFSKHSTDTSTNDLTEEAQELRKEMNIDLDNELARRGKKRKHKESKRHGGGGRNVPKHATESRTQEHRLDDASRTCRCCGTRTVIKGFGSRSELEVTRPIFREVRHLIFKYECPGCGEKMSADPPSQFLENSYITPSLATLIGVSKFYSHQPTYRQEMLYRSQGIPLARSTMGRVLQLGALEMDAIVRRMNELLLTSKVVQVDPTSMPLIVKGKGKVHQGFEWQYRGDDNAPYVLFDFTEGGGGEHPARILKGFKNILQTDGASCFNRLIDAGAIRANCMAHAYRYWEDARTSDPARADIAIALFKGLYDIESQITDWSEEERKDIRQRLAVPRLAMLKTLLDTLAQDPTVTPKSPVGKAVTYCLNRWEGLCRYTEHGFMRPDTNPTEAGQRPVGLGRANWLFAGSVEGGKTAATWMTIIQTCNRIGIDPYEYIVDLLTHLRHTPASQIDNFLPDRWKSARMQETDRKIS